MKIAIVTTTYYESTAEIRFPLAIRTVQEARQRGFDIIVIDGSPDPRVGSLLWDEGAIAVPQRRRSGMGQARRDALRHALDGHYELVCWIEPEKHTLVKHVPALIEPLREGYDMVIPRRMSLESYPPYQAHSELRANRELGNILGRSDLDLMSGPRFMNRKAAGIMAAYDGKYGDNWEILFVPVLTMLREGLRVRSVEVPYEHPVEQRVEDDEAMRKKRDKQRKDLVAAMKAAAADS